MSTSSNSKVLTEIIHECICDIKGSFNISNTPQELFENLDSMHRMAFFMRVEEWAGKEIFTPDLDYIKLTFDDITKLLGKQDAGFVSDRIIATAARFPDKIAVVENHRSYSYSDLSRAISDLISFLGNGVRKGDRVALMLGDSYEYICSHVAIQQMGGIVVPLDSQLPANEIQYIIHRCSAKYILTLESYRYQNFQDLNLVGECSSGSERIILLCTNIEDTFEEREKLSDLYGAIIQFTSGSTGVPKGIVFHDACLQNRLDKWIHILGHSVEDKFLCLLPFSHAAATDIHMYPALSTGATLHLLNPRSCSPAYIAKYIEENAITFISNIPGFYYLLTQIPGKKFNFGSLRWALTHSSPISQEIIDNFYMKFGVYLTNEYGLSETGVTHFNFDNKYPASIGKIVSGVDTYIDIHEEGGYGELVLRTNCEAYGYWGSKLEPIGQHGNIRTGDIGFIKDGYYFLTGRTADVFKKNGFNVYPAEIELCLSSCELLEKAAVLGIESKKGFTTIIAFVVASENVNKKEILKYCEEHLSKYKVPDHIHILDRLPASTMGKIQKSKLREMAVNMIGGA